MVMWVLLHKLVVEAGHSSAFLYFQTNNIVQPIDLFRQRLHSLLQLWPFMIGLLESEFYLLVFAPPLSNLALLLGQLRFQVPGSIGISSDLLLQWLQSSQRLIVLSSNSSFQGSHLVLMLSSRSLEIVRVLVFLSLQSCNFIILLNDIFVEPLNLNGKSNDLLLVDTDSINGTTLLVDFVLHQSILISELVDLVHRLLVRTSDPRQLCNPSIQLGHLSSESSDGWILLFDAWLAPDYLVRFRSE